MLKARIGNGVKTKSYLRAKKYRRNFETRDKKPYKK